MNKHVKKYLRVIKRNIPSSYDKKNEFILSFEQNVLNSVSDRPDITAEELHAQFGTPESVIASVCDGLSPDDIAKAIQKKNRRIIILVASLIIAAVIIAAVIIYNQYLEYKEFEDGQAAYGEIDLEIYEGDGVNENIELEIDDNIDLEIDDNIELE